MKPSKGQSEFDFDRGERLALLNEVPLPSGAARDGKTTVRVSGGFAAEVLRRVESYGRHSGICWASAISIAKDIKRSERQVRRAVNYLESIQFLIVERASGKSPRCRINWGEISLKARPLNPGQSFTNPGHSDTDPGHSDANLGHCVRRSVSKRKRSAPPPSPNSIGTLDRTSGPQTDWQEVEVALCSVLSDWTRAMRTVKQSGVGPRHALELIDHYRRLGNRVGPGALYYRIRRCHPSLEPQDGWMVDLEPSRPEVVLTSKDIYMRVVRTQRKAGRSDDQIRPILKQALERAGFPSDCEVI